MLDFLFSFFPRTGRIVDAAAIDAALTLGMLFGAAFGIAVWEIVKLVFRKRWEQIIAALVILLVSFGHKLL
jgi:hypothetical protein